MNSWYHYQGASYLPNETQLLMQDILKCNIISSIKKVY